MTELLSDIIFNSVRILGLHFNFFQRLVPSLTNACSRYGVSGISRLYRARVRRVKFMVTVNILILKHLLFQSLTCKQIIEVV